jgi:hypothetical protein
LTLSGGARGGTIRIEDATGGEVATVSLDPGQRVTMALAPGLYEIRPESAEVDGAPVRLSAGEAAEFRLPGTAPLPPPAARAVTPKVPTEVSAERPAWKRPVAPIMSALIPGTGQFLNGEIGKGFGMLLGTAALVAGSIVLATATDPLEGAAQGAGSESYGTSLVTATGLGVMTGGVQMLYAAQVMDAYAVAANKPTARSFRRHRLALEVGRSATVGYRVGQPGAALYADWSVSLLMQVIPRLSVGLSDLSVKFGSDARRVTIQGGARAQYRVFEHDRVWLLAGLGSILQGSVGAGAPPLSAVGGTQAPGETSFAVVPYGQVDARFFIVDRWSLNLVPRVSVPFGTRYYSGDRALPSHALTFELGTSVGVYF